MSGILARYLSGIGTDPLNQAGGMEGYLSQYNVNPYWQQFLQNGSQGLLAQTPQYTQGGQNPYYQAEQQPQAQAPAQAKNNFDNVTVESVFGVERAGRGGGLTSGNVTLSNGMVIPLSKINSFVEQNRDNADAQALLRIVGGNTGGHNPLASKYGLGAQTGYAISPETLKSLFGGM